MKTPKTKTVRVPIVISAPSLGERLDCIKSDLALILCGSSRIADQNEEYLDAYDIAKAMLAAARRSVEHAYWLQCLPEAVLAIDAPTDDEANKADTGGAR